MFKLIMKKTYVGKKQKYEAFKISIIYFIIGICWILFSDTIANKITTNKSIFTMVSTYKGIIYVMVTTTILYLLILNLLKKMAIIEKDLLKTYEDLSTAHQEMCIQNEKLAMMSRKLIESERRLKKSQAIGDIGNWEIDLSSNTVWGSEQALILYGIESKDGYISLNAIQEVVVKEDRKKLDNFLKQLLEYNQKYDVEFKIKKNNSNEEQYIHSIAALEYDDKGNPIRILGVLKDITKQKHIENTLRLSEENLRITLQSIGDGVIVTDTNERVQLLNSSAQYMTGWTMQDAINVPFVEIFNISHEDHNVEINNPVKEVLFTNSICELANHAILTSKDGVKRNVADSAAPIKDINGETQGVVMVFRDVTERKKAEREIIYLNYHDHLTGLYNRRFYEEELKRLDVERNLPITLVMADVNGLKITNDAFGHNVGDMLLKKIANILKKECRADEIVSRIGGDEFVFLFPKTDSKDAEKIIQRIREDIAKEKTDNIILSISMGFAVKQDVSEDIKEVYRKAEDKMYKNKLSESKSLRSKTIDLIMNSLYEKNNREMLHSKRVSEICEAISINMNFEKDEVNKIRIAGLMHDIGKIGINDNILNKEGKLNNDEWIEIKRHPEIGYRILSSLNEFSHLADYVLEHHERWDGKGYPNGLKGEEISIEARIIAVADAYDAMTSERSYRGALLDEVVMSELQKNSGTQFDSKVVNVLVQKILSKII